MPTKQQIDFRSFAEKYLRTEKNEIVDFSLFPFLKEIYDCRKKIIVIKKASQMGVSTMAINKVIWLAVNFVIAAIYTMPTGKDVSYFAQTRFDPVIENSDLNVPLEIDNVGVKKIGSSFLFFRGTWEEKQAISIPSDFNVHDEVDFSKPNIVEMYKKRLSASPLAWQLLISTPTIPNYGITTEFEKTNKKEWFVRCKNCGYEQILTEENIIDEEFRCVKCKEVLDRTNGRWIATGKGEIEGYHLSQLMAPWKSATEILDEKETAKLKKHYYNFVLGEEYAGGEEIVTRADILACIVPLRDVKEGRCVVGVDWGDTSWVVVRKGNYIVYMEKIEGDTRKHAPRVAELMAKFNAYAVCDFGYGDTKNKFLIEKFPSRVWMCVYDSKNIYPAFNEKKRIVNVDRTISLQECFGEIKSKEVKIFPGELIETFIQHFGNMVQEKEFDENGQVREIIRRTGDDHLAHAYNYARLLFVKSKVGVRPHVG